VPLVPFVPAEPLLPPVPPEPAEPPRPLAPLVPPEPAEPPRPLVPPEPVAPPEPLVPAEPPVALAPPAPPLALEPLEPLEPLVPPEPPDAPAPLPIAPAAPLDPTLPSAPLAPAVPALPPEPPRAGGSVPSSELQETDKPATETETNAKNRRFEPRRMSFLLRRAERMNLTDTRSVRDDKRKNRVGMRHYLARLRAGIEPSQLDTCSWLGKSARAGWRGCLRHGIQWCTRTGKPSGCIER
jgi:hypothetical protein